MFQYDFNFVHAYEHKYICVFCSQVKGFYKGATASFVGVATESSLLFGAYSQIKIALQV
jgi:hypothetical protein